MSEGKEERGNAKEPGSQQPAAKVKKDHWEKAEIIAKLATPVLIAIFGMWANQYLSNKQETENNIKLYSQLLNDKETAENTLRKDMFGQILQSFINDKDGKDKGLDRIRKMRLSLELLSRNFHESLDMKPLFKHLLSQIIDQRAQVSQGIKQLDEVLEGRHADARKKQLAIKNGEEVLHRLANVEDLVRPVRAERAAAAIASGSASSSGHDGRTDTPRTDVPANDPCLAQRAKLERLLSYYDLELKEVVNTARRVSRKQREVLDEVAEKVSVSFCGDQVNQGLVRNDLDPPSEPEPIEGADADQRCFVQQKRLALKGIPGRVTEGAARHFKIRVRNIHAKSRKVYMDIESWDCLQKSETQACSQCEKQARQKQVIIGSSFWLDYFSFPLVDNTYLDNDHRYSVVLEDFRMAQSGKLDNIKLTLLYYPAQYAGLKEKSFYNNQLLNKLLRSDMFRRNQDI